VRAAKHASLNEIHAGKARECALPPSRWANTRHFDWGRHETTSGWSASRKLETTRRYSGVHMGVAVHNSLLCIRTEWHIASTARGRECRFRRRGCVTGHFSAIQGSSSVDSWDPPAEFEVACRFSLVQAFHSLVLQIGAVGCVNLTVTQALNGN